MPGGKTDIVTGIYNFHLRKFFHQQFLASVIVAGYYRNHVKIFIGLV